MPQQHLQQQLERSMARHQVPGAALVLWHNGQQQVVASGVANVATGVAVTPDTLFHVGSITKSYTATLIMQLVAEGRIDLDQPVCELLPKFQPADKSAARTITPRHLLCHTSGLDGDLMDDVSRDADAVERLLIQLPTVGQLHTPGALFSYCNLGYVILGRLIEVICQPSWDEVLQQQLLQPLGAHHSVTRPEQALRFRTAVGHWTDDQTGEVVVSESRFAPRSNAPAGTMLATTASDLALFACMHLDGGQAADGTAVLPPEFVRAMQCPQIATPLSGRYSAWGLGWMCFDFGGVHMIGHDGGGDGSNAFLRIVPGENLVIGLLANHGRASGVFRDIVGRLLDELADVQLPAPEVTPAERATVNLQPYSGTYQRHGQTVDVSVDVSTPAPHLRAVWHGEYVGEAAIRFDLVPLSQERFSARLPGYPQPPGAHFSGFDRTGTPHYFHFTERAFRRIDAHPDCS